MVKLIRAGNRWEVSGILIDGQTATQNISYLPFGPEEDFVFGNSLLTVDRTYVADYFRLERINAQVLDYRYAYFADGKVRSIDGVPVPEIAKGRTEYVTVSGGNRLDYVTLPDPAVRSYVHDGNGNITSDGVFTYTYSPLNRLIRVEQGAATVAEYAYDPFDRRVKKTVSGTTTHFHYDLQGRLIAETAGDGTPLRDYVYQNGRLVAIKLHGTQAGVYYVISDHLGTPQQIVDSTGAVVWKAAFLPFGEAQVLTETITSNIRFPGQYFDAETGLHYNWHRYYDPGTGRYLTPDPIGLAGGMNLFAYVAGDTVNFVDPTGEIGIVGVAAVVTVALTGGVTYVAVDCIKKCSEKFPCDDPENPERLANIEKCANNRLKYLKFLGFHSRSGILSKISKLGSLAFRVGNTNNLRIASRIPDRIIISPRRGADPFICSLN